MNNMLPAISYMNCVKQYAIAHGMKFFTWDEMKKAIAAYEQIAAIKN